MAGFVGFCSNTIEASKDAIAQALAVTLYSPKAGFSTLFADARFSLSKSYFNFLELPDASAQDGIIHVWVDGEVYNINELAHTPGRSFARLILEGYKNNTLQNLLPKVDGIFIALVYDSTKGLLQIITDRYGLKPFYIYNKQGCLIIAPELKCFTFFQEFLLQIRKDVIDCFMKLEHFIGSTTWFDGVEVTAPSTIYSYHIIGNTLTSKRYWSWASIKPSCLSLDDAAEEMASLLDSANKSRFFGDYKIGVALSGGLDSRAILAAVHDRNPATYTFGDENSQDVVIARRVAKVANVKHTYYDTYTDHWLAKRFSGVWKTDGMLNMVHMHYSHLMNEIPNIMDVNLSGFLGDAVMGGTYLKKKGKAFLNTRINETIARHYYGEFFSLCDPADSFFDLDKVDPYLFYNRGRRMIGLGAEEANKTIAQRLPFMDIKLMDLSYSLPDEFRANSKVYNKALLLKYPEYYKTIPHATTGVPISNHPSALNRAEKLFNHVIYMFKYKLGMRTSFADVYNWIKEPETAQLLNTMLDPKNALYANFTQHNYKKLFLEPHLNRKINYTKQVMGALTMEIWLQQVLNNKFKAL